MSHFNFIRTQTILLSLASILLFLPISASAFFCNQDSVKASRGAYVQFRIDGNGIVRGSFTVIDPGDSSIIEFDKLEIHDELEASFGITGLKPGKTEISVRWEFNDQSANGICTAVVEVSDFPHSYDSAFLAARDYITSLDLDPATSAAFMPLNPLVPGTTIESAITEVVDLELTDDKWFAYIDFSVDLRYGRSGQYLFIDAETGEMTTYDVQGYPLIDGIPYIPIFDADVPDEEIIFGTRPTPIIELDPSLISDEVTNTIPKSEVCAVLVSGAADDQAQREAFEQDVDFVKGNLMRERLGPQLAESDIEVMNNASFDEIKAKLESFQGRYSKVYFYYSGHGSANYLVTNDTVGNRMWYFELASALDATEAEDICVIIDACHSGGAIPIFQADAGLQSKNVTLLTSSALGAFSWTRYIIANGDTVRTGEYTWAWAKCFGDPAADSDGDNVVTIKEAHSWALEQDPVLDIGGTLRSRMDPQCWVHRAPETTDQVIRPSDTRMTIDQGTKSPLPAGSELRIDVNFETDDQATSDTNVYYVSPKIQWDISLVPDPGGYSIGIEFDYDFADKDFTGQGEAGIVWRPDANESWSQYLPTTPDTLRKVVLADKLTHFGQFAVAEVRLEPESSVANLRLWNGFTLEGARPNPFTASTQIDYTIPHRAEVSVTVIDPTGKAVSVIDAGLIERGEHRLEWNGADNAGNPLPSGTYILHLEAVSQTAGRFQATSEVILVR